MHETGRRFISNRAHGALGYAMSAAAGAWFAAPARKCIAVMGDGSFGFTCGEMETLVRLRKHGAQVVDEVVRYQDVYRLCYVRGPEGVLIGLAEQIG